MTDTDIMTVVGITIVIDNHASWETIEYGFICVGVMPLSC